MNSVLNDITRRTGISTHVLSKKTGISDDIIKQWQSCDDIHIDKEQQAKLIEVAAQYDTNYIKLTEPQKIGQNITVSKVIIFLLVCLLMTLFFTGFGYQPIWVSVLVYLITCGTLFSVVFSQYVAFYSDYILVHKENVKVQIEYDAIQCVALTYVKRNRQSPFDINPDFIYMDVQYNNELMRLDLSHISTKKLRHILLLLMSKKVTVNSNELLIQAILSESNLYQAIHT